MSRPTGCRATFSVVLSMLLAAHSASSATCSDTVPVPPDDLDGSVLIAGNASIEAPASFWKWYRLQDDPGMFVAENSMNDSDPSLMFWSLPPTSSEKLTTRDMEELMSDVRKGLQIGLGADVPLTKPSFLPSDTPMPGAYRFAAEVLFSGNTYYVYGYAVQRERLWITQCFSKAQSEPPEFTRFSNSLRLSPLDSTRGRSVPAALMVLIVTGIVGTEIWRRRKPGVRSGSSRLHQRPL